MTTRDVPVTTTATSFRVLEAIHDRNGAGVTELARELDLAKSAVYKHAMTLTRIGYLTKEGTTYHLSLAFSGFGAQARERHPIQRAEPTIDNLARTTGKIANFLIYENPHAVYAYQARASEISDVPAPEYARVPLHATAGGKAILAHLPEDERERIRETALPAMTDKTITDSDALGRELQSIRDRRVAFEREEFVSGYQCVGSPVVGSGDRPVSAVSVSGPIQRMTGKRLEEDIAGLVVSAAKSIETALPP